MSYQVLARKWRPRSFEDMVGQGHVLQALKNALDTDRLHHAYLFSGTRGVGKTTLARILAKCLNCERGVSSTPCGECSACVGIDEGRFVDLIEVDAASRAKVEETRDLMDNVQYAPSMGRYKVYLIDEVHMFSNHSFNALLKTLEEPPPHVKFLLATTEPKKLPITILSRCLQFNLKHLTNVQIAEQLTETLVKESVQSDEQSTRLIASAANGSMRDALSLVDQAISYGNGKLTEAQVREMLGTIDSAEVSGLLTDLFSNDAEGLLKRVDRMAEHTPDYDAILMELLSCLQSIAVAQVLENKTDNIEQMYQDLASQTNKEDVQLFYQIALNGRRDLSMAADPRSGFEMTMIRMLAFRPLQGDTSKLNLTGQSTSAITTKQSTDITSSPEQFKSASVLTPNENAQVSEKISPVVASESEVPPDSSASTDKWQSMIGQMGLAGMLREFAGHCSLKSQSETALQLILTPSQEHLLQTNLRQKLEDAIDKLFDHKLKLVITVEEPQTETPAQMKEREMIEKQKSAEEAILSDPNVKTMEKIFDARVDKDSIRPI